MSFAKLLATAATLTVVSIAATASAEGPPRLMTYSAEIDTLARNVTYVRFPTFPCSVAGEMFLVTNVHAAPPVGTPISGAWTMAVAVSQTLPRGSRGVTMEGSSTGTNPAFIALPGGQRFTGTVSIGSPTGNTSSKPFGIHITGFCGVPTTMATLPVLN